jgi:hypothetical protein
MKHLQRAVELVAPAAPSIDKADLPIRYEAAKFALQECASVDECKDWSDKAAALGSYARQSKDQELERMAQRIRLRALLRCGQLLQEFDKAKNQHSAKFAGGGAPTGRMKASRNAGLSKDQAVQALRLANVPTDLFEEQVESATPPTVTELANQGKKAFNGKPIHERLGVTKQAFQAGMYFHGDMQDYAEAVRRYSVEDIIVGSSPNYLKDLREYLEIIEAFHKKLKAKL